MTGSIRRATAEDQPQVHDLLRRSSLPVDGIPESLTGFVVADRAGSVIGVGGIEDCGREGLLRSVAVDESARGLGIGKRIVERLIDDARASGMESLYLLTTTAEAWFPIFGFTRVERTTVPDSIRSTEEFSIICCASATVMKLDLVER